MMTTLAPTLSQRLLPNTHRLVRDLMLVLGGSILVAAAAQFRIFLPFSPVPITGQTLAVLLVGTALGARRGVSSLLLYVIMGVIGLPFFAGTAHGLSYLTGATGGYLIGFVIAAYVVGLMAERGLERDFRTALLPFLIGEALIYFVGISWLALNLNNLHQALALGFYPFLLGDAIKILMAGALLPTIWKFVR